PDGLVAEQRVLGPSSRRHVGPGEPAWVGSLAVPETYRRVYDWSAAGLLLAEDDLSDHRRELGRDVNGRVVERRTGRGASERFAYEASGDLHEAGVPRRYAPGGRLVERGAAKYAYDANGQVIAKYVVGSGGERVWTYGWSDDGRLMEVRTPEGAEIQFSY